MTCPTCGAENVPDARYCSNCGVPLEEGTAPPESVIICTSCGSENPPEAAYCIRCGALTQGPIAPAGGPLAAAGALPPRDLGDLVTDTFSVYRGNFQTFFLISIIANIPFLISGLIGNLVIELVLLIFGIVFSVLAGAAMVYVVAAQYLRMNPTVGECYRRASRRIWSLLGSAIVFLFALGLSSVTIIGIPLAFYVLVRWYFYSQAVMLEGRRGPREALGRSHGLVKGSWWRVFGIGIVFVIVTGFLSFIAIIPSLVGGIFNAVVADILFTIGGAVVTPIGAIGATLVYIDLRVRKEGYTLETMAREVDL